MSNRSLILASRTFSVLTEGAKGDNATDATAAIQAAVAKASAAGGGTVIIPGGTYKLTDEIVVPDGAPVSFQGEGRTATVLEQWTNTKGGIVFNHSALTPGGGVSGLTIRAHGAFGTTNSTGIGLRVRAVNDLFQVEELLIEGFATGIKESWSWYPKYKNVTILYANVKGVHVAADAGGFGGGAVYEGMKISNDDIDSTNTSSIGIYLEETGGIFFDTIDITHLNNAVMIKPAPSKQVAYAWFDSVLGDSSLADNWYVDGTESGAKIVSVSCQNCWAAYSEGGSGLVLTGDVDSFIWDGGRVRENWFQGVRLEAGVRNVTISDTHVEANSRQSNGTHAGVLVLAGVSDWRVEGCRIGLAASGSTNKHYVGIEVRAGASDNYIITNCDLRNNQSGGLSDGGTGAKKIIHSLIDDSFAYGPGLSKTKSQAANLTNSSDTTPVSSDITFDLVSGRRYRFRAWLVFSTDTTTTGITLRLDYGANTNFVGTARAIIATAGASAEYQVRMNANGQGIFSPSVLVANDKYLGQIEGVILPTANVTIALKMLSEVASSVVTLYAGSYAELTEVA